MTVEKLQFSLPAVFTIGPENEIRALRKYALLLSRSSNGSDFHKNSDVIDPARKDHVQDIVKGIIEGETRVIVSSMSMEEIFKERQVFKEKGEQNAFVDPCFSANAQESHWQRPEGARTIWIESVSFYPCRKIS